jgi:hypothetical protein
MDFVFAAMVIYAAWQAVTKGVPAGARATRAAATQRMASWRAANPGASTPAILANRVASWTAALRWGPGYMRREISGSWRTAWDDAKRKYRGDDNSPQPPQPNTGGPRRTGTPTQQQPSGPRRAGTPQQPGGTVAQIRTATGGEITSIEQLAAECRAVLEEAVADKEDANADRNRANDELARVEKLVASVRNLKFSAQDVAVITRLKEPTMQKAVAADQRHTAADLRVAVAREALKVAAAHTDLRGRAAGDLYQGTGKAS